MPDVIPPWHAALTSTERSLMLYGVVVAAFALLAMLVRMLIVQREISGRYRPASAASIAVLTVAFLSYIPIAVQVAVGYRWNGSVWLPGDGTVWAWAVRYMDWSVTVPLLVVELIAVSSLRGRTVERTRAAGVVAAFCMIATGYLGGVAIDDGGDRTALLVFGLVSTAFFIGLYALVLVTVLRSLPALPSAARPAYRLAMIVLMVTWFVYPVVVGLQGFTSGGGWATAGQLLLCAADVVAKVGFGHLLSRVAKLRTAFDAQAGVNPHHETLWMNGGRLSEALLPPAGPALHEEAETLLARLEAVEPREP